MANKTYRFRIKDSTHREWLQRRAGAVNFVWNYCNEISGFAWHRDRRWLSWVDLQKLTAGSSKEIGLNGHSIKEVCCEFASRRDMAKRRRLRWRTAKRNLGWIPFKAGSVTLQGDTAQFMGRRFRLWKSRDIIGEMRGGSFSQDSRGRWYLNLTCRTTTFQKVGGLGIGIDLGLKDAIVCSDGIAYRGPKAVDKYAAALAAAQRAHKRRRVIAIHAKIANIRRDWAHKTTTAIVVRSQNIFVGDVSSARLSSTRFAKSVYDAGWAMLKTMLEYKAALLGVGFRVVDERYSTATCSDCSARSGPRGLSALGVRSWACSVCGSQHLRDVNAAKNILNSGLGCKTPSGESMPVTASRASTERVLPFSCATIE